MAKNYKNNNFHVQDYFFHLAKEKGYRARSAFKLRDIQNKFRLIRPGNKVIDLGAAPGSFLQVLMELVGPNGKLLGVDLQEMEPLDEGRVTLVQGDILETDIMLDLFKSTGFSPVDVVTSDLAPKTTGIRDMDQGNSAELTDQALFLAMRVLKAGGHFVGKVFDGPDLHIIIKKAKRGFKQVKLFKPPSCRDRSFETYLIALDRVLPKKPQTPRPHELPQ